MISWNDANTYQNVFSVKLLSIQILPMQFGHIGKFPAAGFVVFVENLRSERKISKEISNETVFTTDNYKTNLNVLTYNNTKYT